MQHITERFRTMTDPEVLHEWSESGYCFLFHSVQGDLKWINEKYALFDFRDNQPCSLCGVCKKHEDPSMTIGDFRLTAKHRESTPDLTRFHEMSPSIFSLPCMGPQRVRHDILHSQLLGTGKVSNGSGLVYLSEAGFWCSPFQVRGGKRYPEALEHSLRLAHKDFLSFKKSAKLQVTQPRFTPARASRRLRNSYACLSSKGAPSKVAAMWLAVRAMSWASREGANEMDKLVASCLQCYAELLRCINQSPLIMSQEQATRFHDLALEHLQLCALLNKRSRRLVRQQVGRNLFMMLTKHHHLYEAAIEVKRERESTRLLGASLRGKTLWDGCPEYAVCVTEVAYPKGC